MENKKISVKDIARMAGTSVAGHFSDIILLQRSTLPPGELPEYKKSTRII